MEDTSGRPASRWPCYVDGAAAAFTDLLQQLRSEVHVVVGLGKASCLAHERSDLCIAARVPLPENGPVRGVLWFERHGAHGLGDGRHKSAMLPPAWRITVRNPFKMVVERYLQH